MSDKSYVTVLVVAGAALLLVPSTAQAYVGPGGVITAIGAVVALLLAIVASIAGFLWYPLKRLLLWIRRLRGETDAQAPLASPDTAGK